MGVRTGFRFIITRADSIGVGFNRTSTGSDAVSQYAEPVSWNYEMQSGRSLWNELCFKYNEGVESVRQMIGTWNSLRGKIDNERFTHVRALLSVQEKEARWWRDASLSYFQTFSKQEIPSEFEQPEYSLNYYMSIKNTYAPGR